MNHLMFGEKEHISGNYFIQNVYFFIQNHFQSFLICFNFFMINKNKNRCHLTRVLGKYDGNRQDFSFARYIVLMSDFKKRQVYISNI